METTSTADTVVQPSSEETAEAVENAANEALGKKILWGAGIIVAVWFFWPSGGGSSDANSAANVLSEHLKSPSSLVVASTEVVYKGTTDNKDHYKARIVKVKFDSQNGFGAMLRGCQYVAFWYKGGDTYSYPKSATWPCSDGDLAVTALKAANGFK